MTDRVKQPHPEPGAGAMTKADLALLGRVFETEIRGALSVNGIRLFQTRSQRAKSLVDRGYLARESVRIGGRFPVTVEGYVLTDLGRMTYCESCSDVETDE